MNQTQKRDRKRGQISAKLGRLEERFFLDKDMYYRSNLHELQYKLATLHNDKNTTYQAHITDLAELRDSDLVRLRLWEEYQVHCVTGDFHHDYENTKQEYEKCVDLVRTRLVERYQKAITQLKEDKALMDLSPLTSAQTLNYTPHNLRDNSHHNHNNYSLLNSGEMSVAETGGFLQYNSDRRSRRRRNDFFNATTNGEESNDSATGGNQSTSSVKRKKVTDKMGPIYSHNNSSADESQGLFTDDQSLNQLIYGKDFTHLHKTSKSSTRHSSKTFQGLSGLKPEEVNEDLDVLRSALSTMSTRKIQRRDM